MTRRKMSSAERDLLGVRHVQTILLGAVLIITHMQDGSVGISLLTIDAQEHGSLIDLKKYEKHGDKYSQALTTHFLPMILCCILAGYLTTKVNIKLMLMITSLSGTIFTFVSPSLYKGFDWYAFKWIRVFQGATQGFVRPLVYAQMVRWLPPDELMLSGPLILSGIYMGTGFIVMMGGFLGLGRGGWPSIFYFSGNCGLIWCLAYIALGSSSPETCFYISPREKSYIEESLPEAIRRPYRLKIPWKGILTNIHLYALMIAQLANNWSFQVYQKIVPAIYQNHLGSRVSYTGLLVGLPCVLLCICTIFTFLLLKYLKKRDLLNHAVVRHVCNGIGHFGSFYCYMLCAFFRNISLRIAIHYTAIMLSSFQLYGIYMNYIDLAPNYVGIVVGFCYGIACLGSLLGPVATVTLYQKHSGDNFDEAHETVYFSLGIVYLAAGLIWELFGSTRIQPFNDIIETHKEIEDLKTFSENVIKM